MERTKNSGPYSHLSPVISQVVTVGWWYLGSVSIEWSTRRSSCNRFSECSWLSYSIKCCWLQSAIDFVIRPKWCWTNLYPQPTLTMYKMTQATYENCPIIFVCSSRLGLNQFASFVCGILVSSTLNTNIGQYMPIKLCLWRLSTPKTYFLCLT